LRLFVITLIAMVAHYILQMPSRALQSYLIGDAALWPVDMVMRMMSVGLLTSLVVVGICRVVVLRASLVPIVVAATLAQLFWLEMSFGFSIRAQNVAQLVTRFAEQAGALLPAFVLLGYAWVKNRPTVAPD
jgi:hypothetical protein